MRKKLETSDGKLIYKGVHEDTFANNGDPFWKIYKLTYSGDDLTDIQDVYGAAINWTDRANYFA